MNSLPAHRHMPQLQLNFQLEEHQLAQRQACLDQMENLQQEIYDLHGMFQGMRQLTAEQSVAVEKIADNAEEALENVQQGELNLRRALTYKKAMYPVVGALLGTCVGGPIGLVAGMKAGGLAAVGCGILGFTGGSVLKANPNVMHGNIEEEQVEPDSESTERLELKEKPEWPAGGSARSASTALATTHIWSANTRRLEAATNGVICSVRSYCSVQ